MTDKQTNKFLIFISVFCVSTDLQTLLRINSKLTWSEEMQNWRKDVRLCWKLRGGSRRDVPRKRRRSERRERKRLGKLRRGGGKRRSGGWSARGNLRDRKKKSDKER